MKTSSLPAFSLFLVLLCTAAPAAAEKLFIASAANFIRPLEELSSIYRQQKGTTSTLSYGSSGKLYAQLLQGAPYDMFLSADKDRPQLLYEKGLCEAPFQYSAGQVVLWSRYTYPASSSWQEVILQGDGRIALSNPDTAPYGEIPMRTLQQLHLLQSLESRLVYGQSVGQSFLFARSGAARFAFIALSQAISPEGQKGHYWSIPESNPVEQWGCITTHSRHADLARDFQSFLTTESTRALIRRHGYL